MTKFVLLDHKRMLLLNTFPQIRRHKPVIGVPCPSSREFFANLFAPLEILFMKSCRLVDFSIFLFAIDCQN